VILMILDALAILILLSVWLLGGAAIFHSQGTKYTDVLLGWSVLNGFVVFACLLFYSAFWAIQRILT